MAICSVEEAVEDIRQGRMIILVDDEDRENEGDITIAAEHVTPEAIAQHVGTARFLTQVFKDLYKILAAFPAVKASDADAALAELGCAGRGGSGRRGEENRLRGAFLEQ